MATRFGITLWCLITTLMFLCWGGCSKNTPREDSSKAEKTGTLVLPLETISSSGTRYRLKRATFTIVGEGIERVVNADERSTNEIRVELNPGQYTVTIAPLGEGYEIDRILEDLSTEPAENVQLLSNPVQTVQLEEGVDTPLVFRFEVDGVALGFGDLVLEVEVEERMPGNGGASNGSGGAGGGDPVDAGGATGATEACNECLDEFVPDNLNPACSSNALCKAVRDCVVETNCYQTDKSPSECYCGIGADINDCQLTSFVPTGPCKDEILAAFPAGSDNATVTGGMAAPGLNPSGDAFNILINSSILGICVSECSLSASE